ncbi:unnamed protein product [Rangifer tarandus platyrhynchus]|uniref:Uncharacterized protein n=1 Tax=Rangifer tarandus platyrhynchus TaxID=3082113 RepID=A0AC59Z8I0_RANTA
MSCKALSHPRGDKREVGVRTLPPTAVVLGSSCGGVCRAHRAAAAEVLWVQLRPPVHKHAPYRARAPARQRREAGGGGCAHPAAAHRHTGRATDTHHTPSPPGAERIAPRPHSHSLSHSCAGPAAGAIGGGARPGARQGPEVSEFLRIREPAAGPDGGSGRWGQRTPAPPWGWGLEEDPAGGG